MPSLEKLKLQRILVISPQGLGDMRWRDIGSKLREHPIGLPVERVAGLDKNRCDFSASEYKALIGDDRDLVSKWRARLGWRRDVQNIADYDDCFEFGRRARECLAEGRTGIQLGALCCAISHMLAWRRVAELDEVCLILEDDVTLRPDVEAHFECPSDASVFAVWSGSLYNCVEARVGGRTFKRPLLDQINGGLLAYVLKPDSARHMLNKLMPMPHCVQVDGMVYNTWRAEDFKAYAAVEDWAENCSSPFANPSGIGHNPSWIKSVLAAVARSRLRFLLRPAARYWASKARQTHARGGEDS